MLTRRIIACLDVDHGRVVKGVQFKSLRDQGDPVELAMRYEAQGADEMVFLDIGASHEGRDTMRETVQRTAEQLFIPLTVGGGIRSVDDMQAILRAGADKVAINSAAIADPDLVRRGAEEFGSQCIVVALDAKLQPERSSWELYSHGGRRPTGIDAVQWSHQMAELGAGELLVTSMDRDGTRSGFDLALTAACRTAKLPTIASGGAGAAHDFTAALEVADAALGAGVFHDGTMTIGDVKADARAHGLAVRP